MRASLIAVTLVVQVCTVAVLFAVSGEDTQAYPMEAGYIVKDQNLNLVYFEGTPARLAFQKMDAPEMPAPKGGAAKVFKHEKNLRCERREQDKEAVYRCAVDLRKI